MKTTFLCLFVTSNIEWDFVGGKGICPETEALVSFVLLFFLLPKPVITGYKIGKSRTQGVQDSSGIRSHCQNEK